MKAMPQQSALDGFFIPEPAVPTDRLFFAILPDPGPATAAKIGAFTQQLSHDHCLRGRPLLADRLHITLHHLGDYAGVPDGLIDRACQAVAQISAASFEVTFDRAMSFAGRPRNRPFVMRGNERQNGGLAALMVFQKTMYHAMCRAGLQGPRANAKFAPHVTLMYDDQGITEQAVEPITWLAHDFVLIRSLLGQTKHIHLGRWPA